MVRTDHIVMPENHMEELYNAQNPMVRFVHNSRLDKIVSLLPQTGTYKILDAGCGEGHLIQKMHARLPHNSYYGADITDIALSSSLERCPFAQFKKMDLGNLAYEKESFDIIICTEVLEHIYEYEVVIAELTRVLKKDGKLIISFPHEPLWTLSRFLLRRRPIKVPDHVNSFTPRRLRSKINMRQTYQRSLPFPLPFRLSLGCIIQFTK